MTRQNSRSLFVLNINVAIKSLISFVPVKCINESQLTQKAKFKCIHMFEPQSVYNVEVFYARWGRRDLHTFANLIWSKYWI